MSPMKKIPGAKPSKAKGGFAGWSGGPSLRQDSSTKMPLRKMSKTTSVLLDDKPVGKTMKRTKGGGEG